MYICYAFELLISTLDFSFIFVCCFGQKSKENNFVALKNNLFKKFVKKMSIASFTKYTIGEIEHIFPFLRIA